MSKPATKAQKQRMAKVAELGCVICKGPAAIHHCGTHMGGGRDHDKIIPLCGAHHQTGGYGVALHAGKARWEELHGTEDELMRKVEEMLEMAVF